MDNGDFISATRAVADAIASGGVTGLVSRFRNGSAATWPSLDELLAAHAAFSTRVARFSQAERDLMAGLGLGDLMEPTWWSGLILLAGQSRLDDAASARLAATQARMDLVETVVPGLMALIDGPGERNADAEGTLALVLKTDDGGPPAPLRLASAVQSVAMLWDALCDLHGQDAQLALSACDPEGGATVLFTGDATMMAELKGVFLSVWEQVMLHHDLSLNAKLAAIPPALAVMDRIAVTRPGNAVSLRRRMQEGVRRILTTGAYIPEMRVPDRFTPAELMRPDQSPDESEMASVPISLPDPPLPMEGEPLARSLVDIIEEERRKLADEAPPPTPQTQGPRPLFRTVAQN